MKRALVLVFLVSLSGVALLRTDSQISGQALPPYTLVLTYDDGPDGDAPDGESQTVKLAQWLHNQGIRATFFLNGCRFQGTPKPTYYTGNCLPTWGTESPDIVGTLLDLGHRIGNHTHDHSDLEWNVSAPEKLAQVKRMQQFLDSRNPHPDELYLFRAPYFAWQPSVAAIINADPSLRKLTGPVGQDFSGAGMVGGAQVVGDWDCFRQGYDVTTCGDIYLGEIAKNPNHSGIILIHDREEFNVGSGNALEMTKYIVSRLPRPQYRYVPVDAVPGILGGTSVTLPTPWSSDFSDSAGWGSDVGYYSTIRFGDINGDKKADVCGRAVTGVTCGISTGTSFQPSTLWSADFSDAKGWLPEQYSSTLQLGDVDGDGLADLVGRGPAGIVVALSNGGSFGPARLWSSNFSDANGWDNPALYRSIRLADVNGDGMKDLVVRTHAGVVVALSNGKEFGHPVQWLLSSRAGIMALSAFDRGPSAREQDSFAIVLGDINGDGKDDLCERGISAVTCSLSTGKSFGPAKTWTLVNGEFSDLDGWAAATSYHRTFSLADIDGDGKKDLVGRTATGIVVSFSDGTEFTGYRHLRNDFFTDATGWQPEHYGATVRFADIDGDGKAEPCGRGAGGLFCGLAQMVHYAAVK